MRKKTKKKTVKIGESCEKNEDCINRNCIQGSCVRKNTKKKGFINSVISNTLKKITKTSSLRPVTKKRKKRILIIESSSPEDILATYHPSKIDLNTTLEKDIMTLPNERLNEKYIELMDTLYDIMMKQGEPFRARAYKKAQETIMSFPDDILNPQQLKGSPNIGPTIMEKLIEYEQTGTLRILEREKNNPANILTDVYGIGPKKAKQLVDEGITTIESLRENQDRLNDVQKIGLQYYEDILKRIPRDEIDEYYVLFKTIFDNMNIPGSKFEIVGSYRRGAKSSGDIDVIITGKTNEVFKLFIDTLTTSNIIHEVLSRGATKSLTICKLPNSNIFRRVDFLFSSEEEYPFSVLYFTGSKTFNTVMRGYALKKGFTMNEHGIYHMVSKKKGDKVPYIFRTEEDIFRFLGLTYKRPEERIDGRAVIEETTVITPDIVTDVISTVKNKTVKRRVKKKLIIENDDDKINDHIPQIAEFHIKSSIIDFKQKGLKVLEELNEEQLASIIRECNIAYYNQQPLLTDNEYDVVKEYMQEKYPDNPVHLEIGAPIEKNKVKLPYEMWSMDKIKPDTKALPNWMNKYPGPYVLSAKLDGVSGMYTTEGSVAKLYTRGNGKVGQDISHLIRFLKLPQKKNLVIRGEFIIPKKVFEEKYKDKFANPRNMVSGIINQKSVNSAIKDVHFIAYEVVKPEMKPSEQMNFLTTITVERVISEKTDVLSNQILSDKLIDWRTNYIYEIDGVIVTDDKLYPRKSGNPQHSFAFKMVLSDQVAEAKVVDVIWTPSKDGYLKPRVQIEPISLGGVKIEFATGFNGAFIEQNKIGVGAMIEIIRSGDVIPYIKKVVVPAENALMPSVAYKWNSTHIDIMLEQLESNEIVREKNITGFFRGIGVEGLSSGNIKRLIDAGYDTVPKILSMSLEDYLSIDGFKQKLATKIYEGIRAKIDSASLVTIMSASNSFGRGFSEKKMELIITGYPDVLVSSDSDEVKIKKIMSIKGMALKTAELFVQKIPEFLNFMKESHLETKLEEKISVLSQGDISHPLYGKTIVLTGFRDPNIIIKIKEVGAKQGSSVSRNTALVIVKDEYSKDTGKAYEASKLNIPIMTKDEFISAYM